MGLLERHKVKDKKDKKRSRVIAKVIEDRSRETLHPIIEEHVEKNATLYTDSLGGYTGLPADYVHDFVDHVETYVRGAVHVNGMENFWALFKRCIKGTHVAVEPFHLEAYVDSEAFRFNERGHTDGERFVRALGGATGRRVTYKQLIGESGEAELPVS